MYVYMYIIYILHVHITHTYYIHYNIRLYIYIYKEYFLVVLYLCISNGRGESVLNSHESNYVLILVLI